MRQSTRATPQGSGQNRDWVRSVGRPVVGFVRRNVGDRNQDEHGWTKRNGGFVRSRRGGGGTTGFGFVRRRGVGFDRRERCRNLARQVGREFEIAKSVGEIFDTRPRGVLLGSQDRDDLPGQGRPWRAALASKTMHTMRGAWHPWKGMHDLGVYVDLCETPG
jgi:hypothetical protein